MGFRPARASFSYDRPEEESYDDINRIVIIKKAKKVERLAEPKNTEPQENGIMKQE